MKNRYIKTVKKNISPFCSERKRYLSELDAELSYCIAENPETSYEELCETFGIPEVNAEMFMESLSEDVRLKIRKRKTLFLAIMVLSVILIAIIVISVATSENDVNPADNEPVEEIYIKDVPPEYMDDVSEALQNGENIDEIMESIKNGEYENE